MKSFSTRRLTSTWMALFFILPLFYVLVLSVLTKGTYGGIQWQFSLDSIEKAFGIRYLEIFVRTLVMAFVTAAICSLLGAFCAWFIVSRPRETRNLWLGLFILPFLLNSLIRLHALQSFIGVAGPFRFLSDFTHSQTLMYVGLVLTYLPFAILPLTAAFEKWDPVYFEAAQDLGAPLFQSLLSVVLPLLKRPLITSFLIVFIPALGEFLVPEILGGSQKLYWGQLIAEAYLKWRDWPLGSAFGLILIGFILIFFMLRRKA